MKYSLTKLLSFCALLSLTLEVAGSPRPNVLFIAIDDLRPELGCYGSPIAKSPILDQLAGEGLLFNRAYCQQAICSPSRASLMTGARPDTIGVIENTAYFRELNPDIVTLPQHFISNGYEAVYCGKIYHSRMTDNDHSWSRKPAWNRIQVKRKALAGGYALPENQKLWKDNKAKMLAKYGAKGAGGLVHGPAQVIETMIKLQQYTFVCAPQPAQWAGITAMDVEITDHVDDYRRKRDMVVNELANDFEIVTPGGAFYVFPRAPGGEGSKFVMRAIENNLLIIPGAIFSNRDTHFRISYAADDETIARGIEVLRKLCRTP